MWKTVAYNKKEINVAGRRISDKQLCLADRTHYLDVIDNWRAAHAFPMNTFAINLKHQVSGIEGAIVVQRLKRLDTIIGKLKRYPDMELYRMQDLGGCRVIVPTIEDVYSVKRKLTKSRIRHEVHNEKDYIAIPKPDTGYRGVHLIYRYKSDKRNDYNGLQIEVQIRTKLQHLWATAVETVGVFTQNGLKFNQGSDRWLRFFKVTSALFAIEEESAVVEGVSTDPCEIVRELLSIIDELKVFDKLYTIGLATDKMGHAARSKTPGYYLMVLNIEQASLVITKYAGIEKALDKATDDYNKIELQKGDAAIDAVLVSALSFEALTHAYPNYFADIKEFTTTLSNLLKKYTQ